MGQNGDTSQIAQRNLTMQKGDTFQIAKWGHFSNFTKLKHCTKPKLCAMFGKENYEE